MDATLFAPLFYIGVFCALLYKAGGPIFNSDRATWATHGILVQTACSLALVMATHDPLYHAGLFVIFGVIYLVFSAWVYGAALGICSALISINHLAGWAGFIPIETGQGWLAHSVWHYQSVLAYTQLWILWEMSNALSDRVVDRSDNT